ncbi:MAG: Fructose-2,6-bisphosphatase [Parcubacteria group bacterium]|nr:Fructose-2,6-bisphosphatase [Parcubacteria group bacterium]
MRVYLVRHAERADQSDPLFASADVPLTDYGRRQAALLAERFATIPIQIIYSSGYVRTRETAEIINRVTHTDIEYVKSIEELGHDEKMSDVFKRANEFVQFLTTLKTDTILVSAHAGIIKMIVFAMVFGEVHLGPAFDAFNESFHMDYTGITLCRYEIRENRWYTVTWNDLGHLPPPT